MPLILRRRPQHIGQIVGIYTAVAEAPAFGVTIVAMRASLRTLCSVPFRIALSLTLLPSLCTATLQAASTSVVISQVYTAGGNGGATYNADFVEIFNLAGSPVSLNGYALQYFSATGTGSASAVIALPTGVTLAAGQHYLVQATPAATGAPLPNAADFTSSALAMGASAGRIYLTSSTTALSGANGCPSANVVDYVGYGNTAVCFEGSRAPAPSSSQAIARTNACVDADSNGTEFALTTSAARNQLSAPAPCSAAGLLSGALATPSTVTAGTATLLTGTGKTGLTVTADLRAFAGGSGTQPLYDDGTHGDVTANDGTYSYSYTVPANTPATTYTLTFTGTSGLNSSTVSTALAVQLPVALTPIHTLQGNVPGTSSYAGQTVSTSGIVIDVLSSGFHIQARDSEDDTDPHTPEGIYVYTGGGKVPANVTVGTEVEVTGKLAIYPTAATTVIGGTEIDSPTSVTVLSTGNALPAAIQLTTAYPSPAGGIAQLPYLQSMRVRAASITVTQPTDGNLSEANETYTSNGIFWGEITGLARPTREAGLDVRDPLTVSQPASIPRFDSDPETFEVDSYAAAGANSSPLNLATGAVLNGVIGTMDLSTSAGPRLVVDAVTRPTLASAGLTVVPVPDANAGEVTIGDQNMERFYDTVDDPTTSDVVLTPAAYKLRLAKASLGIRNVLKTPDILALEEMETLTGLNDLSAQISGDALAAGQPDPHYQAYLSPGNDIGGINVGFLIKPGKVDVLSVDQFGKTTTFTNAVGAQAILNDRPPLVLHAGIKRAGGADYPITVIVNHLRSLNGVTDASTTGQTVRLKREYQAEYLANLIQGYQAAGEHVIAVGDFNAFDVNDGIVDSLGVIKGGPALVGMDILQGTYGLVNPILVDAAPTDVSNGAYSYVFSGYAQSIDHFLMTQDIAGQIRTAPAHWNADFPVIDRNDATRPEASSDHDGIVGYLSVPSAATAPVQIITTSTLSRAPNGAIYNTITVTNTGGTTAENVTLTSAVLGGVPPSYPAPPITVAAPIAPGGSYTFTLSYPGNSGAAGTRSIEKFTGTYTGGSFGGSQRVVLP